MGRSERSSHNFTIYRGEGIVVKYAPRNDRSFDGRIRNELHALGLIQASHPDVIPTFRPRPDMNGIELKRLETRRRKRGKVSTDQIIEVVEALQETPIEDSGLPRVQLSGYVRGTIERLNYLQSQGRVRGFTKKEVERLKKKYLKSIGVLEYFSPAFVHTDVQRRHFGKDKDGNLKIFDFDQAHVGSELEDFAWLMVRHPRSAKKIKAHLKQKLARSHYKLAHLEEALEVLKLHFTIKGCYDRTYQSRGRLFDTASKAYGRLLLHRK